MKIGGELTKTLEDINLIIEIISKPDWMHDFHTKKAHLQWRIDNRGYPSPASEQPPCHNAVKTAWCALVN